jgi:predicted helicase
MAKVLWLWSLTTGFIDNSAFDGMRKHLSKDFNVIYIVDLKGNIRKDSMRDGIPLGEKHTVFGLSAMVGVSLSFFVKKRELEDCSIFYNETDFRATRDEKFRYLGTAGHVCNLEPGLVVPDRHNTWLTEELDKNFETLLPIGTKDAKAGLDQALFKLFSLGVATNRDAWAYNFSPQKLAVNIKRTIDFHNEHIQKWQHSNGNLGIDDFVENDDTKISWTDVLKHRIKQGWRLKFDHTLIRRALYRPFTQCCLYFDPHLNQRRYQMPRIVPGAHVELENRIICLTDHASEKPFMVIMTDFLPDLHLVGAGCGTQCFPYYVYDEDGTNRRENITDWAVEQFKSALKARVDKWQILHYVYGLLHSPEYREKYQANLKRELPRIPLPKTVEQFQAFVSAGERLADLHVNYESQPEHPLEKIENPDKPLNWRVEKMKLTKDKTTIVYNDFLTLAGIPPEVFEYRLGNRSALDWIIDRYQVRTDKRSGIVNDPNRADDPQYIVRLIGKVITVSLETVKIVSNLPKM